MLAAGASEFEIQEILGHDEVGTSRRIYMHILEDDANTTAAKGGGDAPTARLLPRRPLLL